MYLTGKKLRGLMEEEELDILTFVSDRGGRKTSAVQIELINRALEKNRPFVVMRSKKDEYISASWLSEYALQYFDGYNFITEKLNGNIVRVSALKEGDKIPQTVYFGVWLSLAEKYKSNHYKGFERVEFYVWEECVPNVPIPQNVANVERYRMQKLTDVLSIASTISRRNRPRFIFLGNDIAANIINPITVSFNLLERLSANCEIRDTVEIDDREYHFYFSYFDFPGAVNHWLINQNANISTGLDVSGQTPYHYIIKSQFNTYYLYSLGDYYYVGQSRAKNKRDVINTPEEFFRYYGYVDMWEKYKDDISTALVILFTYEKRMQEPIRLYFGEPYYPQFHKQKESHTNSIINLYELRTMGYYDILNLRNIDDIRNFANILKKGVIIYDNVAIKLLCDSLKEKLIFE